MKSIAILPLRAGSKGIINKNKLKILGRPLFSWVLTEAIFSNLSFIYVFTDDSEIINYIKKEYAWSAKVIVVKRSEESASDTASTEFAMLELAKKLDFDFDYYCLLQATSPLTNRSDINTALDTVSKEMVDSTLSVVENKRFIWNEKGEPQNYDYIERPRRQDFQGMLVENGAIYIISKETYKQTENRLGGNIKPILMSEDTLIELDEKSDLEIIKGLLKQRLLHKKGIPSSIKYLCLDVDGVFTDATVIVNHEGEFGKKFSFRDGMGLALLREEGVKIIVITSEDSMIVKQRMDKLGIDRLYMNVKDKYALLDNICLEVGLMRREIAYIGDDINDLSNIASCGLGICPNDAVNEVKSLSDIILNNKGGETAIRETCELVIKHNKRFCDV